MMIEPSIDKMLEKTEGNIYVLANVVAKRAKEIETIRRVEMQENNIKPIAIACQELIDGKFVVSEF